MKKLFFLFSGFILFNYSAVALNPVREYSVLPSDYGMAYEEVSIKTQDNLTLKGWFFRSQQKSVKVIILSDDGNGNMSDILEIAANFISMGYNVLTYDYRGYGQSDDFEIKKEFFIYAQFEKDLSATIDWVRKYNSSLREMSLYGIGIGAGLAISVGCNRSEVSRVIADSPYNNFEDIQKRIKEAEGVELKFPLAFDKNMLEPTYALEKSSRLSGILYIVGEIDAVYNPKYIKELTKQTKCSTSLYVVKGAKATGTFSTSKSKYYEEIQKFLR